MDVGYPFNKDCSFMQCADRQKQLEYAKKVTELTLERDALHEQMKVVQNTLAQRKDTMKQLFEELLREVKIMDNEKVLDKADMEKIVDKVAGRVDDSKLGSIVGTNMSLNQELHRIRLEFEGTKTENEKLRADVQRLEDERIRQEKKDIEIIRQHQKAEGIHSDLLRENEELDIKVRQLRSHKEAILQDIEDYRQDAKKLIESHRNAQQDMEKWKMDVEYLRKESTHYKKFWTFRSKRAEWAINTCQKYVSNGKMDKARVKWVDVQRRYAMLSEPEQRVVRMKYDDLLSKMEPKTTTTKVDGVNIS